jgi:hypothetical protein
MEVRRSNLIIILALIALSSAAIGETLSTDYYQQTCPNLTKIVCDAGQKKISETAVLYMHFNLYIVYLYKKKNLVTISE